MDDRVLQLHAKQFRYRFAASDSGGTWGDVEVTSHAIEPAIRAAELALAELACGAVRPGLVLKVRDVRRARLPAQNRLRR